MSLKEVRETLPQPWEVAETLDGRYLFIVVGGKNTWSHPTPGFNQDLIKPDEDPPSPQLKYEALSYTWGSMEKAVSARVIDETTDRTQTIALGAHLADALEHLRLETESRTLWVDAICINQADIEERNAQVKRMGSIYTLAERVVIWLGPETSDSNLALSTMQYLADQVENTLDRYNCDTPDAAEPLWFNRAQALPYNKQTWAALLAFFQRPWFSRLWVMQEAQLSNRRAIVHCGSTAISWISLQKAIQILHVKQLDAELALRIADAQSIIRSQTLRRVLTASRRHLCFDPRDKIYGLLALLPAAITAQIQPQYKLPVADIYRDFVMASLNYDARLSILTLCQYDPVNYEGPSWTPNLAMRPSGFLEPFTGSAAGDSAACAHSPSRESLYVSGKDCATITTVSDTASGSLEDITSTIYSWAPKDI